MSEIVHSGVSGIVSQCRAHLIIDSVWPRRCFEIATHFLAIFRSSASTSSKQHFCKIILSRNVFLPFRILQRSGMPSNPSHFSQRQWVVWVPTFLHCCRIFSNHVLCPLLRHIGQKVWISWRIPWGSAETRVLLHRYIVTVRSYRMKMKLQEGSLKTSQHRLGKFCRYHH